MNSSSSIGLTAEHEHAVLGEQLAQLRDGRRGRARPSDRSVTSAPTGRAARFACTAPCRVRSAPRAASDGSREQLGERRSRPPRPSPRSRSGARTSSTGRPPGTRVARRDRSGSRTGCSGGSRARRGSAARPSHTAARDRVVGIDDPGVGCAPWPRAPARRRRRGGACRRRRGSAWPPGSTAYSSSGRQTSSPSRIERSRSGPRGRARRSSRRAPRRPCAQAAAIAARTRRGRARA